MSKTGWDLVRPSFLVVVNGRMGEEIRGVEVGAGDGKNAVAMLEHHPKLFLHLVDTVDSKIMRENIKKFESRTTFLNFTSVSASKTFEDRYFDYIYIDASHKHDDVLSDLTCWYPKIREGGVFGGHDWWYDEVRQAVCEFFSGKGEQLYAVHNFCIGTVPSADAEMMDWWVIKRRGDEGVGRKI